MLARRLFLWTIVLLGSVGCASRPTRACAGLTLVVARPLSSAVNAFVEEVIGSDQEVELVSLVRNRLYWHGMVWRGQGGLGGYRTSVIFPAAGYEPPSDLELLASEAGFVVTKGELNWRSHILLYLLVEPDPGNGPQARRWKSWAEAAGR